MTKAGKPQNPVWTFDAILRANKGWCTYLQGKRITSAPLSDGDEILIGKARLIFRFQPPSDATDTVATVDLPGNS